jgi:predicted nuclease of predicted toxin-antitoxin system
LISVRLYLDQCLRAELAEYLHSHGHDVVRAAELNQARADDALILERARQERRILVTLDEHFGDWTVLPLSEHFGVIRVKAHPPSVENVAKVLLPLLAERSQVDFQNHLVIVSSSRVRWIQTSEE